jgi:hypothetical protein
MCQNETYSRVWLGKHLSDIFPIRNGFGTRRSFIAIAFQLCFIEYSVGLVQGSQSGFKLYDTRQLLVYADDDSIYWPEA